MYLLHITDQNYYYAFSLKKNIIMQVFLIFSMLSLIR